MAFEREREEVSLTGGASSQLKQSIKPTGSDRAKSVSKRKKKKQRPTVVVKMPKQRRGEQSFPRPLVHFHSQLTTDQSERTIT